MFDKSRTGYLQAQERFVMGQVSTTAGMPLPLADFAMHHFTAVAPQLIFLPEEEFIEIKVQEAEPVQAKGGLLAAIGAWKDYENIDEVVKEIYIKREGSFGRPVDL